MRNIKPYDQKTAEEDFRLNEKLAQLSIVASNFMMTGHSPTLVLTKREEGDEVLITCWWWSKRPG